jgi:hypothetical protein
MLMVAARVAAWTGLLLLEFAEGECTDTSREIHQAALAAADGAPSGSRLVIGPDVQRDGRWIWKWTLPFALQPPFARAGLYQRLEIMSSVEVASPPAVELSWKCPSCPQKRAVMWLL